MSSALAYDSSKVILIIIMPHKQEVCSMKLVLFLGFLLWRDCLLQNHFILYGGAAALVFWVCNPIFLGYYGIKMSSLLLFLQESF